MSRSPRRVAPPASRAGDSITYTVRVTNGGPNPATNVTLVDSPSGAYFVSATTSQELARHTIGLRFRRGSREARDACVRRHGDVDVFDDGDVGRRFDRETTRSSLRRRSIRTTKTIPRRSRLRSAARAWR
ncbi:MAG: DUF11 domain-containing protein [Blastocatellia bacterium]|nr:DUF11 domain-containing protein [Blastocatellia bacterium]